MKKTTLVAAYAAMLAAAAGANSFRVTPYVQRPATNAMTVMWLAQEAGDATISWWPEGHPEQAESAATTPREATELGYLPSQTNYPGHFIPFTTPWQHQRRVTGLATGASYGYAVEMDGCAYTNRFRTAPGKGSAVRFTCYADSETQPESTGSKVGWEDPADDSSSRRYYIDQTDGYASNVVTIARRHPDLMLVAGDLAEMGSKQVDWDEFWRHNAGPINDPAGSVPLLASPGNHEYHDYFSDAGEVGMRKFISYFDFNTNGVGASDQQERFHRLDYGPVTFLFLDANNGPDDDAAKDTNLYLYEKTCRAVDFNPGHGQYAWLEAQLADAQTNSAFTFVVSHQCPYSVGYHGRFNNEDGEVLSGTATRVLTNLLFRYGVDGWLCGHDELYEHSRLYGTETLPDGTTRTIPLHVYDTGMGGDGLRGRQRTLADNPYEVFRAHVDAPEVYDARGILVDGGKHYGHLEVNVATNAAGLWQATLTPVYVFVTTNTAGQACSFERRTYADELVLTNALYTADVSQG